MKRVFWPLILSVVIISLFFVFFESMELFFQEFLLASQNNTLLFVSSSFLMLSSDILLPVPSSIVMFYNGLVLDFFYGSLLSLASVFISSTIGYYLGRFTAFGMKQSKDEKATHLVNQFGGMAIIITRGIPILSESICFTAGYNKMKFKYFSILNFIGYLPVCFIYAYFGSLGQEKNLFFYALAISLILSLIFYIIGKKILDNKIHATH